MSRALPPALLFLAYGIAFGVAALGGGLLAFDDHPGQLYRLYHVVTLGWAPWRLNSGWWAGYAELQYYPPGAAWLGAAIHACSMGAVGVDAGGSPKRYSEKPSVLSAAALAFEARLNDLTDSSVS